MMEIEKLATDASADVTEMCKRSKAFAEVFNAWDGELQDVAAMELAAQLDDASRAQMVFQLLTHGEGDTTFLSHSDKQFALELSDLIGPDHAQWLYRFAVLCTKLA